MNKEIGAGENLSKDEQIKKILDSQPKKGGNSRKKVTTAVAIALLTATAITVPVVIHYSHNKGYTITVQYNVEGLENYSTTVPKGSLVSEIAQPELSGYFFAGFYQDEDHTMPLNPDTEISEDTTVYLYYIQISYKFTSIPSGVRITQSNEEVTSETSLHYGDEIEITYTLTEGHSLLNFAVTGLEQIGDALETESTRTATYKVVGSGLNTSEEAELTVTFEEEINKYKVTFINYNGETYQTQTIAYGEKTYALENPTKPSNETYEYHFIGWSTSPDTPAEDVDRDLLSVLEIKEDTTLYAIFEERYIEYDIILDQAVPTECVIIAQNINGEWKEVEHTTSFHYGDEITITYQASEGHSISENYIKSGVEETGRYANGYPIYRVTGDVEVIYSEHLNTYVVGNMPSNVTVMFNGQPVTSGMQLDYGTEVTITYTITEGYHETEFKVEGAEQLTTNTYKITGILNITYAEEINTYIVTFYDHNGSYLDEQTVNWGTSASIETPIREDDETYTYTFANWVTSQGGDEVADLSSIKQDTKVYASYTATHIEYTIAQIPGNVTIKNSEGDILTSSNTLHYGDKIYIAYTPTEGYHVTTFEVNGASELEEGVYEVTGNLTVTYSEAINTYTVTFYDYDGSQLDEITVNWGEEALISNPTREDDETYTYTFANWVTSQGGDEVADLSSIKQDIKVYASYTATYIEYGVSITQTVGEGGTFSVYNETQEEDVTNTSTVHYGDVLTISYTESTGYHLNTFEVLGANKDGEKYVVGGAVNITYIEEINTYTLTYDTAHITVKIDGITVANGEEVEYNSTLTIGYQETEGYTKTSIKVNGEELVGETYLVTDQYESLTITYEEKINSYTVTFYDYNGSYLDEQTVNWGTSASITAPTREEDETYTYSFSHWSTTIDGEETDLTSVKEDMQVYAVYTMTYKEYSIADIPSQITVYYLSGTSSYTELVELTSTDKVHYGDILRFAYTTSEGKEYLSLQINNLDPMENEINPTSGYITGAVTGDITITYQEQTAVHEVNFYNEDGSELLLTTSTEWGTSVTYTGTTPTKEATAEGTYTFAGWSTLDGEEADLNNIKQDSDFYAKFDIVYIEYSIDIPEHVTVTYISGTSAYEPNTNLASTNTLHYADEIEITLTPDEDMIGSFEITGAEYVSRGRYKITDHATITYTEEHAYLTLEEVEGGYSVTGLKDSSVKEIVIPSTFNNQPVITIGSGAFYGKSITSVIIPDSVKTIEGGTSYSDGAFANSGLRQVTIGKGVENIGNFAFYSTTALTDIYFNAANCSVATTTSTTNYNGIFYRAGSWSSGLNVVFGDTVENIPADLFYSYYYAFNYSSNYYPRITSVVISDNVKTIGSRAFMACRPMKSITLGNGLTNVNSSAFYACTGLEYLNYTGTLAEWCKINFASTEANPTYYTKALHIQGEEITNLVIPDEVLEIGSYTFSYCENITSLDLNNVETIGNGAFYYCSGLTEIVIPDSVTTMGSSAFSGCTNATTLTIGNGLTAISNNAFSTCLNLSSLTIGKSVSSIGSQAFVNCYALAEVYNYSNLTISLGNSSNGYAGYYAKVVYNASSLTGEKPASRIQIINDIQYYVYGSDYILLRPLNTQSSSYEIDNRTTAINQHAFTGFANLLTILITDSVTSIGNYAFYGCKNLSSIKIPSSVISIDSNAFSSCTNLIDITIDSAYAYGQLSETVSSSGYLGQYATTIRVLKSIVDDENNMNDYLNDTANFTREEDESGLYYIYTKA